MSNSVEEKLNLTIGGQALRISEVCELASCDSDVRLETDRDFETRMQAGVAVVEQAVAEDKAIYGVTTGFGGMAGVPVPAERAAQSQNNLLAFLACGAGDRLAERHVRAAMLLRANVLARGCSGVRPEIVTRLLQFLEAGLCPVVRDLGSIGASGDLVPLSCLGRAITGQTDFVRVRSNGDTLTGPQALAELGLEKLDLLPKEGLAIVNGTSFSSAIAANCVYESRHLVMTALGAQAMMLQALQVQEEPFEAFVHRHKPHPGQVWSARIMKQLLTDGRSYTNGKPVHVQDRYSLRCLPQYTGPLVEGIARIAAVVETEMNAVSDNPLVDCDHDRFYQSGNFLGQYVALAMDDLRRYLGLFAKHLDVQIATLVSPEFSNGLPPSLRGNEDRAYNMGLKGLQITGNSIMPLLTWHANPIVEHFPTHAEQFNQNINGLSWGSANLAWKSVDLFRHYLSVALIFAVQAVDLRTKQALGHYDGRAMLGTIAANLYEAVYEAAGCSPTQDRPFVLNDQDQWLEQQLAELAGQLTANGAIAATMQPIADDFENDLGRSAQHSPVHG